MRIRIVTVGRISKPYRDIFETYRKRLKGRGIELDHVNLNIGGDLNRESPDVIRKREARRIREYLVGEKILLDREGERVDSLAFSRLIESLLGRNAVFVIGGPLGVDLEFKRVFDEVISLSDLTLSHEVAFTVLLEQIFRAYKIIRGERYHY